MNGYQRMECGRCGETFVCRPGELSPMAWLRDHFASEHGGLPRPRVLTPSSGHVPDRRRSPARAGGRR